MNATAALPVVGVDLAKSVFQLAVAERGTVPEYNSLKEQHQHKRPTSEARPAPARLPTRPPDDESRSGGGLPAAKAAPRRVSNGVPPRPESWYLCRLAETT